MKPIEIPVTDEISVSDALDFSGPDVDEAIRVQKLADLRQKTSMRRTAAWFLFGSGGIVLATSLVLIVAHAFWTTHLPDATVTTLVGSVAVEFVGMLWLVIKYLFEKE